MSASRRSLLAEDEVDPVVAGRRTSSNASKNAARSPRTPPPKTTGLDPDLFLRVDSSQPEELSNVPAESSASIIRQQSSSLQSLSGFGHFTSSAPQTHQGIPIIEIPSSAPQEPPGPTNPAAMPILAGLGEADDEDEDRVRPIARSRSHASSRSDAMIILDLDDDEIERPPPELGRDEGKESVLKATVPTNPAHASGSHGATRRHGRDASDDDEDYEGISKRKRKESKKAKRSSTTKDNGAKPTRSKPTPPAAEMTAEVLIHTDKATTIPSARARQPAEASEVIDQLEDEAQAQRVGSGSAGSRSAKSVADVADAEDQEDNAEALLDEQSPDAHLTPSSGPATVLREHNNQEQRHESRADTANERALSKGSSFWGKPLSRILGSGAARRPGLSRRTQIPTLHTTRKSPPPPKPKLPPPKKVKKTRSEWSDDGSVAAEEEEQERLRRERGEEDSSDEDAAEQDLDAAEQAQGGFEEELEAY